MQVGICFNSSFLFHKFLNKLVGSLSYVLSGYNFEKDPSISLSFQLVTDPSILDWNILKMF